MNWKMGCLAGVLLLGWITALLFAPPYAGLADNSDYDRVLQPAGFVTGEHPRYANAYREYRLTPDAGTALGILFPSAENPLGYVSSLQVPLKAAMLLNFAARKTLGLDPLVFDMRWLGIVYAVLYASGLALLAARLGGKRRTRALVFALAAVMLCDIGYLLYFHSFYGEALTLSSFVLAAGCAAWLVRASPERKTPLLLFYAACLLFVSAKVANAPAGVLAALFGCALLVVRKDLFSRAAILIGGAALLLSAYLAYDSAPPWMKQVNMYQAVFFGILKDSPAPESDLQELGIPVEYAALHGTHGYMPNAPYDIYGARFQQDVYDRVSVVDLALFYVRHPGRLIDKLELSAESSLALRPAYLGNQLPGEGAEGRYSFTGKLSLWEPLRKRAAGFAFPIVLAVGVCYAAGLSFAFYRSRRRADPRAFVAVCGASALALTSAMQFAIPVIGNGEADLQKHMFLFTLSFDLLLLIGAAWIVDRIGGKTSAAAAAAALLAAAVAACGAPSGGDTEPKTGDTVRFGSYDDRPLLWTVLAKDGDALLLWSRDMIAAMPYDASDETRSYAAAGDIDRGSNDWASSDVRGWLNGPFLEKFSPAERSLIRPAALRTIVAAPRAGNAEEGDQPHYWNSHPLYVQQNEERAYAYRREEQVFLLDAGQLQRLAAERGISLRKSLASKGTASYWLRSPYASGLSEVRVVGADGFIYHRDAFTGGIGVVPALYVRSDTGIASGSGSVADPYVME